MKHPRSLSIAHAGFVLYVVFLLTAPFEHHDLLCELKTPRHCTACASSQLGADPTTTVIVGSCHLLDVGSALPFQQTADGVLLAARSTGRSPPTAI